MFLVQIPIQASAANVVFSVSYIDANGNKKTFNSGRLLDSDSTAWNYITIPYVLQSDVTISKKITVTGYVELVLCDNCTLTASQGIALSSDAVLIIYAQSTGDSMGSIVATGGSSNAAIGASAYSDNTTVIINGGNITATVPSCTNDPAGIGGAGYSDNATVTINGGNVTATGSQKGIGTGYGGTDCSVTINGGTVTANGIGVGDNVSGEVNINGGVVFCTDTSYGGIDTTNEGDWNGIVFSKTSGTVYGDVTLTSDLTIPSGYELEIPNGCSLTVPDGVTFTVDSGAGLKVYDYGSITVSDGGTMNVKEGMDSYGVINVEGTLTVDTTAGMTSYGDIIISGEVSIAFNKCLYSLGNMTITEDGKLSVDGTLYVHDEKATLTVDGALEIGSGCVHSVLSDIVINGTVTVGNSGTFETFADVTISEGGEMSVESGGSLIVGRDYWKYGTLTVDGTLNLASGANVTENGEIIIGSGTISGDYTPSSLWTASITITSADKMYDGDPMSSNDIEYTYTGDGDITIKWYSDSEDSIGTEIDAPSDAGTYWVGISASETAYYSAVSEVTQQFAIVKAYSSVTESPEAAADIIYNGNAQALVTAGSASGGTMVYRFIGPDDEYYSDWAEEIPTGTNAGIYSILYMINGDSNHYDNRPIQPSYPITVTIAKADSTVTAVPTANTLTYNGNAQALVTAGSASGGTMVYSLDENGDYSETIPTGTNAGSYTVYYKVSGDSNHNDSSVASVDVTIAKKSVTASISGTAEKTYDGTTSVTSGLSLTLSDVVEADSSDVTATAESYTYNSASVDISKTVTASNITLSGDKSGNYVLTSDTATASGTITAKNVTATVTAEDKTYDGTTAATVTAAVSEGVIDGDSISISGLTGTFSQANVGENLTVTVNTTGAVVSGTNYSNYSITYNTSGVTASITKADPAVTAPEANSLTYNGKAQDLITAGSSTGGTMMYCLTEDGDYSETIPTGTEAGDYTVYYKVVGDDNYNDSAVASVTVTIAEKSSSSGSSSGSTSKPNSSSSSSTTTTAMPTSSDGTASGWTAITADISQVSEGSTVAVDMNGTTDVPAAVIAAIGESGAVVTFVVDDTYSWTIDGSQISGTVSSVSLAVSEATVSDDALDIPAIEGSISTAAFTLSGVDFGINPTLTASLGASAADKFVNLYKLNAATGELEFVAVTKADAEGNAVVPVESDGTYVIVLDSETELPGDIDNDMTVTAKDAALLLMDIVNGTVTYSDKSDLNGDGRVDAFDAAAMLKAAVGLD